MANNWISVKEALPEMHSRVLITINYHIQGFEKVVTLARRVPFSDNQWLINNKLSIPDCFVTHWQPLPDPPNEGE